MPRLMLAIIGGVLPLLALAGSARAADAPVTWRLDEPQLPEVVVRMPGGGITAMDLRAHIRNAALANPRQFGLGELFLRHALIQMAAARLALPQPSAEEIQQRFRQQVEQAGDLGQLREKLHQAGLTLADFRRELEESLLFEAIVRKRLQLTEVSAADAKAVFAYLQREYRPVYRGLLERRAATVDGRNFSVGEVIDFCLTRGRDRVLRNILENLVNARLIKDRAEQQGLNVKGLLPSQVCQKLLAPELTPAKLKAWYATGKDKFPVLRGRHIFCAFDRRPGRAYRDGNPTEEQKIAARMRADSILAQLRQGELEFDAAARHSSDCFTASAGGDLGYLARSGDAARVPPQAYGLGFIRTPRGQRSPISLTPAPAIYAALARLQDGETSGIVATRSGYSIVQRLAARSVRNLNLLLPLLQRRRYQEKLAELLVALRAAPRKYRWTPEERPGAVAVIVSREADSGR